MNKKTAGRHTMRRLLSAVIAAAVVSVALAPSALADETYYPNNWNGKTIFLSKACHDGNDGVPGGSCIPNYGCRDYNENVYSLKIAREATTGAGTDLLNRGYRVIIGTGTAARNIERSNAARVALHVPVHTNARRADICWNDTATGYHGTEAMYYSTKGKNCAASLRDRIGPVGPGSDDRITYRSDLGELTKTTAVACYLEAEYHTWNRGVIFLENYDDWTWRIGYAIDVHLGYP